MRLDPEWVAQLRQSLAGQHRARVQRDAERARLAQLPFGDDCDEHFAYIAGYTSNGFPYGITWEEWREIEAREKAQAGESNVLDETLPKSASRIWPKDKSNEAQAGEDGLEIPF